MSTEIKSKIHGDDWSSVFGCRYSKFNFPPKDGKENRKSLQWFSSQTILMNLDDLSGNSRLKPWSWKGLESSNENQGTVFYILTVNELIPMVIDCRLMFLSRVLSKIS